MQAAIPRLRERRNLSEIVSAGFSFYARDWRGFVTIGAGTIPISVPTTLILAQFTDPLTSVLVSLLLWIPAIGPTAVIEAAVIQHLVDLDEGAAANEARSYRAAFARVGDLIIAVYKLFLAVILLLITIIGIPAGIERMIRWIFVPQAIMIDGQTRSTALTYSFDQTKGHWWRTFGRLLFISLVVGVLGGFISGAAAASPLLLYALLTAIFGAFTTPYFSIAITLMYFDLKLRKAEEAF